MRSDRQRAAAMGQEEAVALIPAQWPEALRRDIAQDIALAGIEGSLPKGAVGVKRFIRKRASAYRDGSMASLDAFIRNDSPMRLGDVVRADDVDTPRKQRRPTGRPVTRKVTASRCEYCRRVFYFRRAKRKKLGTHRGRFCSRTCWAYQMHTRRRKLPAGPILKRLYVDEGWPTTKIAKEYGVSDPSVVRQALERLRVTLRRHTSVTRCIEPGCGKPVFKTKHAKNGSMYGTRCEPHWVIRRRWLNRKFDPYVRMLRARA